MKKWNYTPELSSYYGTQTDWNQTLIVKINQLSVGIHTEIRIKVPNKFNHLIESLAYFDTKTSKIGNRFIVEFIESDENIIHVGEFELEIENFKDLKKLREETIKYWECLGVLDGLSPTLQPKVFELFESKKTYTINEPMENLNEIKKLLNRVNPIAVKNEELSSEYYFVYELIFDKDVNYMHYEKVTFVVPVSNMGNTKFGEEEPAQLLIRWITTII